MTTFLLVRHGVVDGLSHRLAGRLPGVALNQQGSAQARRLADRLRLLAVPVVYSSPVQRAVETATAIATACAAPLRVEEALQEVEFGEWTGRTFDELTPDPAWSAFNQFRTVAPIGGGSSMLHVQARVIGWLARTAALHEGATVVAVSHADVIRAALAGCAGISLDLSLRLDVSPASISEICIGGDVQIRRINDTAHLEVGELQSWRVEELQG